MRKSTCNGRNSPSIGSWSTTRQTETVAEGVVQVKMGGYFGKAASSGGSSISKPLCFGADVEINPGFQMHEAAIIQSSSSSGSRWGGS